MKLREDYQYYDCLVRWLYWDEENEIYRKHPNSFRLFSHELVHPRHHQRRLQPRGSRRLLPRSRRLLQRQKGIHYHVGNCSKTRLDPPILLRRRRELQRRRVSGCGGQRKARQIQTHWLRISQRQALRVKRMDLHGTNKASQTSKRSERHCG